MKSTWSCETQLSEVVAAGTTIRMNHVWGWTQDNDTCEACDIKVKLEKDSTLEECMNLLEDAALAYVNSQGCDDIRHYFIECVYVNAEGDVNFAWGT